MIMCGHVGCKYLNFAALPVILDSMLSNALTTRGCWSLVVLEKVELRLGGGAGGDDHLRHLALHSSSFPLPPPTPQNGKSAVYFVNA